MSLPEHPSHEVESPPAKITHGSASLAGYAGGGVLALLPLLLDALTSAEIPDDLKKVLVYCGTALVLATIVIRGAQAVAVELRRGR